MGERRPLPLPERLKSALSCLDHQAAACRSGLVQERTRSLKDTRTGRKCNPVPGLQPLGQIMWDKESPHDACLPWLPE